MRWLSDLWFLFFPVNCMICHKRLPGYWQVLCLSCEFGMPRTGYRDNPDNPVSQIFWGRVPVEAATSLFRFEKGSPYQSLLHALKYRGNRPAGIYLGKLLGHELKESRFSRCDFLIPVPIHKKRMLERGYNQAEIIASGISSILEIPVKPGLLERHLWVESQTSLGRYERYENVSGSFRICTDPPDISGKQVLLVDDVVTTGATLEACTEVLINCTRCRVLIATVSCA